MDVSLDFAPLLPLWVLAALAIPALLVALAAMASGRRGGFLRVVAISLLAIALLNPIIFREQREPVKTVVVLVADRSQSQSIGDRQTQMDTSLGALRTQLEALEEFEVREVEFKADPDDERPSTTLFDAAKNAMQDVPASRVGGTILITDGQVHDIPQEISDLEGEAPVHGLITGRADEQDRRIAIVNAPRFGIVGEDQELLFRVVDEGEAPQGATVNVSAYLNGELVGEARSLAGADQSMIIPIPRGGSNILELVAEPLPGEITETNNRAVARIDGIRENLRVLLVSGEPHAGERTWRNLLKSDAAVDLVHFTILRPPEKQDGTPINELSLIAFPTRELFVDKINEFDLIIFDRYKRRGVLPVLYYDYIAQYVEDGGAVLIAAGPEHAGTNSIDNTPLNPVLPATPTGEVTNAGYFPRLSEDGQKHPVTRGLPGSDSEPPQWSRWFRNIEVSGETQGNTVLEAGPGKPLLVLSHAGEGRVALLLSDQGWLWARGFEGGGPHVQLYRRIAHWLMKEPDLDEEALTAVTAGNTLTVERQTMGEAPPEAEIVFPSGETSTLALTETAPGRYSAELESEEIGLFQITNGDLRTLAHLGAVDAPEFQASISTTETLQPVADETGGSVVRIGDGSDMPSIDPTRNVRSGGNRLSLRLSGETVLTGVDRLPLFYGFLGLGLLLLAVGATWYREGR